MKRRRVAALPALALASCGTLISFQAFKQPQDCKGLGTMPSVYSGVVLDVKAGLHYECRDRKCGFFAYSQPNNVEFLLLDVPLSFVLDTVVLPYSVYRQITHGNICPMKIVAAPPVESTVPEEAPAAGDPAAQP